MGRETKISWADHSASPWVGCSVAHAGCLNCYARDFSQKKHGKVRGPWALWGPWQDRLVTKGFWTDAPKWARAAASEGVRRTVFPSLMDPLDAEVYERTSAPEGVAYRATFDLFMHTIRETAHLCSAPRQKPCPNGFADPDGECVHCGRPAGGLTWLLLTKRPENWRWIPEDVRPFCWLLYSASDQATLDAGVGDLLDAEGFAGLGLSLEPLVGPVDLRCSFAMYGGCRPVPRNFWCIIGGEAGRGARPCNVEWIRNLVRQCREAGVGTWVKQMGARSYQENADTCIFPNEAAILARDASVGTFAIPGAVLRRRDPAGADPSEWPEDLRVQEFPEGLR